MGATVATVTKKDTKDENVSKCWPERQEQLKKRGVAGGDYLNVI